MIFLNGGFVPLKNLDFSTFLGEIMFLFYVFCQRCPQTQPTGFYNTVGLNDDDLTKSYKSHSCTCEIVLDKLVKLRKQKTSEWGKGFRTDSERGWTDSRVQNGCGQPCGLGSTGSYTERSYKLLHGELRPHLDKETAETHKLDLMSGDTWELLQISTSPLPSDIISLV